MAKKRIYEVARELNLSNKEVVDKLKEMGISMTHTSSVDDEITNKIKAAFLGKKKKASVEETRIKPTIIRRRRKTSKKEAVHEADQQKADKTELISEKKAHTLESGAVGTVAKDYPDTSAIEKGVGIEKRPSSVKKSDGVKKSSPKAVVIKKAPEKESSDQDNSKTDSSEKEAPVKIKEETLKIDTSKKDELKNVQRSDSDKVVSETEPPKEIKPKKTKKEEEKKDSTIKKAGNKKEARPKKAHGKKSAKNKEKTTKAEGIDTKTEKPKSKKSKKRRKKDTPAKIIKLAVPPIIENKNQKKVVSDEDSVKSVKPDTEKAVPLKTDSLKDKPSKAKKSKKKKKGNIESPEKEELQKDKKTRKRGAFKKKSVVEGKDLYDDEASAARKARKASKNKSKAKIKTKTKEKINKKTQITVAKAIKRRIKIDDTIVIAEFAKRMGIKAAEIIKKLMGLGVMTTVNHAIDFDTALLVASEFDYEIERASFEEETVLKQSEKSDSPEKMQTRPPVVTIMGHVDHGKTSLLDVIRKSSVTEGEAGHITQHIGAYHVSMPKGSIVFLDTPGHEAFTAMRSRGASVTDIVVLVVAADDGVMPQTIEAVNHSKAANVPIIVAINKIDKPNAEPERVQRELTDIGLTPEDWGGETIFVKVSAKQKQGIDNLLEMILLQAEFMELTANPDKAAAGHVIEAKLDSGRGSVATVLIQEGTLHIQDSVVCGLYYGKLRSILDDRGKQINSAGPSMPVEIIGLSGVPSAGDEMLSLAQERDAKQISEHRIQKQRSKELARQNKVSLENLFEHMREGEIKELNLIIKADVHGSIEALKDSLIKLSNEEVKINIVHSGTGTITESDVSLAEVSKAIIIGFNVRPNPKVQALATESGVDMHFYNIIYDVINEVRDAIVGMMASTFDEHILGRAEVRQIFTIPKIGTIAGSYVTDGKIVRNREIRLLRDGVVIYEGKIGSLRRFKDDAKEVQSGYECGIGVENYNDIKLGDVLECYYLEEIKPKFVENNS